MAATTSGPALRRKYSDDVTTDEGGDYTSLASLDIPRWPPKFRPKRPPPTARHGGRAAKPNFDDRRRYLDYCNVPPPLPRRRFQAVGLSSASSKPLSAEFVLRRPRASNGIAGSPPCPPPRLNGVESRCDRLADGRTSSSADQSCDDYEDGFWPPRAPCSADDGYGTAGRSGKRQPPSASRECAAGLTLSWIASVSEDESLNYRPGGTVECADSDDLENLCARQCPPFIAPPPPALDLKCRLGLRRHYSDDTPPDVDCIVRPPDYDVLISCRSQSDPCIHQPSPQP